MGCNQSKKDNENISKTLLNNPIMLGEVQVQNRIAMGPMTRQRGDPQTGVPNDLMKEYYTQRAGFGFILTECSHISALSNGFPGAGGIYTDEQVQGWKKIVDSVHEKNCKIFLQIVHVGRAIPSEFINGEKPIAPSPIAIDKEHPFTKKPHPVPREMNEVDIQEVILQFRQAAENAKKAGFDGVELHAANGYLVDQFLKDGSNQRKDQYGGSIINRARFLMEVLEEFIQVYGSKRVGVRFSPTGRYNDMYDSDPLQLMKYVLQELDKKDLAFVELKRHGQIDSSKLPPGANLDSKGRMLPSIQLPDFFGQLRQYYKGVIMGNDGFNPRLAYQAIQQKKVDMVSFSSLSISNPDLPNRIKNNYPLNMEQDRATYYTGGAKGYTDYPVYQLGQMDQIKEQVEQKVEQQVDKLETQAEQVEEKVEKKIDEIMGKNDDVDQKIGQYKDKLPEQVMGVAGLAGVAGVAEQMGGDQQEKEKEKEQDKEKGKGGDEKQNEDLDQGQIVEKPSKENIVEDIIEENIQKAVQQS